MTITKYGLLGPGYIAHRFAQAIQLSQSSSLVAVASTDLKRSKEFAEAHHIPACYGSYEELLEDDNVDIVYISNRHNDHYKTIMQSLRAHKHVLVEKPMVLTKQESIDCFEFAKVQQRFLMEAQKMPFLPLIQKVQRLILEGVIGDVRWVDTSFCFQDRFDDGHWMISKEHGGGLFATASYGLTLITLLASGKLVEVQATASLYPNQADRFGMATLMYDDGLIATTRFATDLTTENKAYIYGSKGYFVINDFWKADAMQLWIDGQCETIEVATQNDLVYEIDHVSECLLQQKIESSIMSAEISIQIADLIETIKKRVSP